MTRLEDFDYPLPKELIAQSPLPKRDASKLLTVCRREKKFENRVFSDLEELIPPGDVLVLNDTKVFLARLLGKKKLTGGKAEVLLLEPTAENNSWKCLLQPAMKEGQEMVFEGGAAAVFERRDSRGIPVVRFADGVDVAELSKKVGTMPLPPYIKREPDPSDTKTYQTVYAKNEGAVAAPTAGLHFTPELLKKISDKGVGIHYVTLHVGYGTFKPVEDLENHQMHVERFELSEAVADTINKAKAEGRKVWAVGTTTLRVLETCVQKRKLVAGKGETDLYIKPPFEFEAVDRLITNFHLPKTTLLLLVSAFMGEDLRKKAYAHAIENKYRFYSYGDAMVII